MSSRFPPSPLSLTGFELIINGNATFGDGQSDINNINLYDDSRITVGPTGTFTWNSFESLQIVESGRTPCFLDIQGQFLVQGDLTITNLVVNVGENAQVKGKERTI